MRRGIPYGVARGTAASPMLALMTGVVVTTGCRLLVALLGGSPALVPGRLATALRTVPLTAITATTEEERPATTPAESAMKGGNLKRGQAAS